MENHSTFEQICFASPSLVYVLGPGLLRTASPELVEPGGPGDADQHRHEHRLRGAEAGGWHQFEARETVLLCHPGQW